MRRVSFLPLVALSASACFSARQPARQEAALLAEKGRYADAARVLRTRLSEEPRDVEARRLLVRVLALSGDLGAAQREAGALAKRLGSTSPVPFIELGYALELAHRYEEALALYDHAGAVAPRDPTGPLTGGLRAARWGEAELAAPRLEEALRRDPKSARAWHALGVVRLRLGDLPGAELAYRSGLQADPNAVENRLGLATLAVTRDDPAAALEHYNALLAARPRFADGWLGRSWALLRLGRLDEAERALASGLELGANRDAAARQRALIARLRARKIEPAARPSETPGLPPQP
jgi:tetratricopeptide (TPR) repeat protein